MTPRFNPDVNGYWMCDIGRFDYHWVEGERALVAAARVREPASRRPVAWKDALVAVGQRAHGREGPRDCASWCRRTRRTRRCSSLGAPRAGTARRRRARRHRRRLDDAARSRSPSTTRFKVPEVDAPNVAGARALGLVRGERRGGPTSRRSRRDVEAGRVSALFVLDPGPAGIARRRVVDRRRAPDAGKLPVPRSCRRVECERPHATPPTSSCRDRPGSRSTPPTRTPPGQLQSTAKAVVPPGEARDDWQILVDVALAARRRRSATTRCRQVREALAALLPDEPALRGPDGARVPQAACRPATGWSRPTRRSA